MFEGLQIKGKRALRGGNLQNRALKATYFLKNDFFTQTALKKQFLAKYRIKLSTFQ